MNEYGSPVQPLTRSLPSEGMGGATPQQKRSRGFLLTLSMLGVLILIEYSAAYALQYVFPNAPKATLYLANWSGNPHILGVDNWDLLVPYHPNSPDMEVDAEIADLSGFNALESFGIVIGNSQEYGYLCGHDPYTHNFIERSSPTGVSAIPENVGWFSHIDDTVGEYSTYTVTLHKNVITLFINGGLTAQATVNAYPPNSSIGVYGGGDGGAEVRSFRVEKLL